MATEAWVVPTVDMLDDYLAAAAMAAFKTAALNTATPQTNPFLRIMPNVVAKVRGYIASCDGNALSATANSVPPALLEITLLLIIKAMQGRLPGVNLTKGQEDILKEGMEMLKDIASCDIVVSSPTDPADDVYATGPNAYLVSNQDLVATPDLTGGIS